MLHTIRKDGSGQQAVGPIQHAAILRWWAGQGNTSEIELVEELLTELHRNSMWLSCDCLGTTIPQADRPVLAPGKTGETLFLRRLPSRASHHAQCQLWYEQSLLTEGKAGTSKTGPMSAPSFLITDDDDLKVASQTKEAAHRAHNSHGESIPKMARRLFWLAQSALWQRSPCHTTPVKSLLEFAQTVPVKSLTLKDMLFCDVRGWTERWYESVFGRCTAAGIAPSCWWVQLATGYDTKSRTITYLDSTGRTFSLPVLGAMHVFGGDISAARFPMVVIALIRRIDGKACLQSAYAHPVLSERRWMLVDSDLERRTYDDLASVCAELVQHHGVHVLIDKPVTNLEASSERPDFVLSIVRNEKRQVMVVETMGFDDPQYLARKRDLVENSNCPFFFDHRAAIKTQSNLELVRAVRDWALR